MRSAAKLLGRGGGQFFVAEAVDVGDVVPHVRVVDRTLGLGFPRIVGALVVGEHADDVDVVDVLEHVFRRIDQFAAEHEVKSLGHSVLLIVAREANLCRHGVKDRNTWYRGAMRAPEGTGEPMRVMLLGATGTAGRATLGALLDAGHEVVALHRGAPPDVPSNRMLSLRKADVGDPEDLERNGFRGETFDALVTCLASRTGTPGDAWAIDHRANAGALSLAGRAGVRHVVLMSAICVQKPRLAFQRAKLAFEAELMASGLDYSIVRPTSFFKSLSGQIARVRDGKPFLLFGNGELTRCKPISDRDLGRFMALCLTDPDKRNCILPVGGPGPAISPREQGEALFRLTGKTPRFRQVPVALFGAIGGALGVAGVVSAPMRAKAELARIGRYYATESMLVWDENARRYDADATPEFGQDTLFQHYAEVILDGGSVDLGEHRVFGS